MSRPARASTSTSSIRARCSPHTATRRSSASVPSACGDCRGGRLAGPIVMPTQEPRPGDQSLPRPPFPEQKLDKPGLESQLEPRPHYEAPAYKPAGKLAGKKALITGGDSGIGRAVAVMFAREGADIVITYLPAEQSDADETRRAVEAAGRRCVTIAGDLADSEFCRELVERAVDELGGLDVLVSNAAHQNRKQLEELTPDEIERTFKVNVFAYMYLT